MKTKYIILVVSILLLWGCEEDVRLDLGEIEKKLVVEARISNETQTAEVSLSYSQNFYDMPIYERLTNATVILESETGQAETLSLNTDSVYVSKTLKPEFGKNFTLKVKVDDNDFEVKTFLPVPMNITNTVFVPNPFYKPR
jgi:hypothetical protein